MSSSREDAWVLILGIILSTCFIAGALVLLIGGITSYTSQKPILVPLDTGTEETVVAPSEGDYADYVLYEDELNSTLRAKRRRDLKTKQIVSSSCRLLPPMEGLFFVAMVTFVFVANFLLSKTNNDLLVVNFR